MQKADIGLIGLAVMGQNLALNMNDHGFKVAVFNRTVSKVDDFLNEGAKGTQVIGAHSLEEFVSSLSKPRRVMLMIKAGKPVDTYIELLLQYLEPGDIIIDGGNSNYNDTIRRAAQVESKGLLYIGMGVSGGEEGARYGPSIMPGGSPSAWPHIKPIFQAIAAKVKRPDGGEDPCCDWVGENGAGHYVKMVHNGIEYGDMQLICEAYQLMREGLGLSPARMHAIFDEWNQGKLESYLIEITRERGRAPLSALLFEDWDEDRPGRHKRPATAAFEVLRAVRREGAGRGAILCRVAPGVAAFLAGEGRADLAALESLLGRTIRIHSESDRPTDHFQIAPA